MTDSTLHATTDAQLRETLTAPGVHVVHFWAPWCDDSTNQLGSGWPAVIEAHPDASFSFVAIWNDGADGAETLREFGLPERAARLALPGPKPEPEDRRLVVLDRPVTWIPTTWVFVRGSRLHLAYALAYGETPPEQIGRAIAEAAREG